MRSKTTPCVVLDATEIHRDWFLAGLEFPLLRFLSSSHRVDPVVPASVVAEAVANHERHYTVARRAMTKAATEFRRVTGVASGFPVPESNDQLNYELVLRERFESLWIEVAATPQTPHEEIVARAVSRRPPFDQNGSGYRDTLTWMTCVELANQGRDVYLVSQDKDFAGRNLQLAPQLEAEVAALEGNVTLVRNLGKWLTEQVPWKDVSDLREASGLARDEQVAAMFAPWDMFEDPGLTAEELGLPPDSNITDVSYGGTGGHGFGYLERLSHEKTESGANRVVYEFPIEFEVEVSMNSEEARQAGLIQHENNWTGVEQITTSIPMTGLMTVVHDERDVETPLYFDSFEFVLDRDTAVPRPGDHPDQLRLFDGEGGASSR
ncbi:PIN domain-containing protein [Janibacter sp. HTCC2649]|uniref:PIN domain-containing protein n=1 Tax=Janibacter sp. HTCC2649 TaxID=313589 RepID=UPI0013054009|nr:PIN domain-containing protein [Janibacter sp. HTCC2649]